MRYFEGHTALSRWLGKKFFFHASFFEAFKNRFLSNVADEFILNHNAIFKYFFRSCFISVKNFLVEIMCLLQRCFTILAFKFVVDKAILFFLMIYFSFKSKKVSFAFFTKPYSQQTSLCQILHYNAYQRLVSGTINIPFAFLLSLTHVKVS